MGKHTLLYRRPEGIFGNHSEICPQVQFNNGDDVIEVDNCTLKAAKKFCDRLITSPHECTASVVGYLKSEAERYNQIRWHSPKLRTHYRTLGVTRDVNSSTINVTADALHELYNASDGSRPCDPDRLHRIKVARDTLNGPERDFYDQPCEEVLPGMCCRRKADGSMIIEV